MQPPKRMMINDPLATRSRGRCLSCRRLSGRWCENPFPYPFPQEPFPIESRAEKGFSAQRCPARRSGSCPPKVSCILCHHREANWLRILRIQDRIPPMSHGPAKGVSICSDSMTRKH